MSDSVFVWNVEHRTSNMIYFESLAEVLEWRNWRHNDVTWLDVDADAEAGETGMGRESKTVWLVCVLCVCRWDGMGWNDGMGWVGWDVAGSRC